MKISDEQLKKYDQDGFLFLPDHFSGAEVERMKIEIPALFNQDSPTRVVEKGSNLVRSVYGSHTVNEVFRCLTRAPRLVEPVRRLLGKDVYVYQFKINAKAAFRGDLWEWHQDYIFWRNEDRMPAPQVVSVVIYLDEVTEFNGPIFLIPGSHRHGVIEASARSLPDHEMNRVYQDSPRWINNLTADLKYSVAPDILRELVERNGMISMKGPAGSAFFFHGNLVHGSSNNISPYDRTAIIITYNSVENIPLPGDSARPDFLVSVDHRPIIALSDDALLKV